MRYAKYLLIIFFLVFAQNVFAWNAVGHAVIAQIAYDNLTPQAKKQLDELVIVFAKTYPQISSFQKMAGWADTIKNDGVNEFNDWHFIDIAFSNTNLPLPRYSSQNIAWEIIQFQQTLAAAKTPFNRALALAFLSHFVGDIEQPLHCATRVTKSLPKGDQGGNLYSIQSPYADNLHSLWDQGVGLYVSNSDQSNTAQIQKLTTTIERRYPPKYFKQALDNHDPKKWAYHSFNIAKDFAYSTPENKKPDDVYVKKAQKIVMRQTAVAGYRLADILNTILT